MAERDGTVDGQGGRGAAEVGDSLKKPEPKVAEGERKIEIPLPSDRDMDRMMAFLEQAWKPADRNGQPYAEGRLRGQDLNRAAAFASSCEAP